MSTTSGLIWSAATRPTAISSPAWVRRVDGLHRELRPTGTATPFLDSRCFFCVQRRSGGIPAPAQRTAAPRRRPRSEMARSPSSAGSRNTHPPASRSTSARTSPRSTRSRTRPGRRLPQQLRPVDVDFPLRRFDRLPSVRPLVEPLTPDLDRRGQRHSLHHSTGRQREIRGHVPGLGQLPVRVPRGRAPAQSGDGPVGLGQRQQVTLQPRRPAQQDEQQPGRKRVERARVTQPSPQARASPGRRRRAR